MVPSLAQADACLLNHKQCLGHMRSGREDAQGRCLPHFTRDCRWVALLPPLQTARYDLQPESKGRKGSPPPPSNAREEQDVFPFLAQTQENPPLSQCHPTWCCDFTAQDYIKCTPKWLAGACLYLAFHLLGHSCKVSNQTFEWSREG